MSEENIEGQESAQAPRQITVNDKTYDWDSLGEKEIGMLTDIRKIEIEIERIELQKSIADFAKSKIYEELTKRLDLIGESKGTE